MNVNETLNGFKIVETTPIKEIDGNFVLMKHEKSGARLLWLDRPDVNKTFSITFRTIPTDDTGIFHILEHSVLCGSKKFDVKEPFVELIKNSMNTFLNAMTFPDKTMYPICTKNDKDYFNLMEVYLDAVFYPSIYKKPEIFYQEGWHYEFDENDNISYKGVVFNEMKGVYADADSVEENAICQALFPDNCYSVESGGYPASIPTLSYEQFIDGHKTFYHPSNSYIILDGSIDINKVTEFINDKYLKDFDTIAPCPLPNMQQPIKTDKKVVLFEQAKDMPLESQSRLSYGYVIGTFKDREKIIASHILSDVLCENNQSYLTKAIMSKGLAESVEMRVLDGIMQPFINLGIKNINEEKVDEIETTINEALNELCKNGIDQNLLEAVISNLEFTMKEKDFGYPKGLYYAMTAMETWLYDGDAKDNLSLGDLFEALREKAKDGYFESLIKELMLNNNHKCSVIMKPSYTIGDEQRAEEQAQLDKAKNSWSKEDIEYYKNEQAKLEAWQASEDTPEALAQMPMISISDIDVTPEELPLEKCKNILNHNIKTDGITYLRFMFDITGVSENELPKYTLLASLLGDLDTENHTVTQLKTELMAKCGNVSFAIVPLPKYNNAKEGTIKFVASVSALDRYVNDAIGLVKEILTTTKFDDKNAIIDIIKQSKIARYQSIVNSGSMIAMKRAGAGFGFSDVVSEYTSGFAYYQWLKEQENDFSVIDQLADLMQKSFGSNNLIISIANEHPSDYENELYRFSSSLPNVDIDSNLQIKPWDKMNEAIVIPGDIAFSAKTADFSGNYTGLAQLMSHITSFDYLWNEIRVKGGAYGTGLKVMPNDSISAYSYRDPNAPNSISTFGTIGKYVREFAKSDKSLVGFIIGAMSSASPLLTPKAISVAASNNYFCDITFDSRQKLRKEIVNATKEELLKLADTVESAFDNGSYCVIGSQKQIDKLGNIDKIYSL